MTSTGFLKAKLEYHSKYDIQMWFIFQIASSIWPLKCKFVSLFCWEKSKSKSKQTQSPWYLMPIGAIRNLNTQNAVLTNSNVLVASVVNGEWRWQPQQNLPNSYFIPYMSASAIECRIISSCCSSGLCVGPQDHRSPLPAATHTASLWHTMPVEGYQIIFKNLCYNRH